jgi:hypothetical protein
MPVSKKDALCDYTGLTLMAALRSLFFIVFISMLIACDSLPVIPTFTPGPTTEPEPTPTLLGTVRAATTSEPPTSTPRPDTCVFRLGPDDEVGVYRFDWDNATFTLDTKLGPIIVDGPRTLTPGPRQLILTHPANRPPDLNVIINFDVNGTLLYDVAAGVQEVRDAGGTVQLQNLTDPANDTKGMPTYLDIVRVERNYGYYPTNTVRVYLAGVHSGALIWSSQDVAITVGKQAYTYRKVFDESIQLLETDSLNRTNEWKGPVTVEGNVVAFELQVGIGDAVTATTSTSSGSVDIAGPYPVQSMQALWDSANQFCP